MPKRLNIQVPNRDCEYWDLTAVSKGENYNIPPVGIDSIVPGLSGGTTTNWTSFASDVTNRFAVYNLKALVTDYTGRPTGVAKSARNLNVHLGPQALQNLTGGAFNYAWVSYTKGNNSGTIFQRVDDPNITIDPAVVFPSQAAFFNQFRDRFSGHFDAAGSPVVAVESSLTQISVFKASLANPVVFNGYSPIILNSTQFLGNELFVFGDNIVFYTKDTVASSTKGGRRGNTVFCRVERDNYATEYTLCSGLDVRFLELTGFVGNRQYLLYRDSNCNTRTLESAVYTDVIQETISGSQTPQSIQIQTTVVVAPTQAEEVGVSAELLGVSYVSVVKTELVQEEMVVGADISDLEYLLVVITENIQDEVSVEADLTFLNYVFDPIIPPPPDTYIDADAGTEQANGTFTPQSINLT